MTTATADPVAVEPAQLILGFIERLQRRDPTAVECCHDDIVYINHPFTMARTLDGNLRWVIAFLLLRGSFELRVENIAANGDTVLTERTDIFRIGRFELSIWATGTHVMRDGKIALWHDRFDYADAATALPRAVIRLLRGRRV